jgi:hypothetical protein
MFRWFLSIPTVNLPDNPICFADMAEGSTRSKLPSFPTEILDTILDELQKFVKED